MVLLAGGVGLGYGLTRNQGARKVGLIVAGILFATPIVLFLLANALNSETLGWIAGIGMMVLLAGTLLLSLGALVGWWLARRSLVTAPPSSVQRIAPAPAPKAVPSAGIDIRNLSPQQRSTFVIVTSGPALLWVVITIGFWINEPYVPGILIAGFLPTLIVVIAACWMAVRHIKENWSMPSFSFKTALRNARASSRSMAEHKAWLARIAADPQRRRYYDMIQAGDLFWTPDRVEYDLDPHTTACCKHLAPIERDLRDAGIDVKLSGYEYVLADCRIDPERLKRRYRFMEPATYQEYVMNDRGADHPVAQLVCECRSGITVLHPQQARDGAPVFPPT